MLVKNSLVEIAQSTEVASVVSALTTITGLGTILDVIPEGIGKLATLVGIVLSVVLIYTHLRRDHLDHKKTKLEILIIEEKRIESLRVAEINEERANKKKG